MSEEQGKYRPLSYFQLMEISLRELLVEKGILTNEQVDAEVENMRSRTPERGAKVVARAWVDPAYRKRLLENGTKACEELGLDVPALKLVAVENTPQTHNAIVCTLCSCYPRWLLGLPPDWYKSRNYRSRMVREPRAVLREFGPSASFGAAIIGEVPREETKVASSFERGVTFGAGLTTGAASSRRITPALLWLSRSRNLVASHLKM